MFDYQDLKDYIEDQNSKLIIAADAETITHRTSKKGIATAVFAGGVSAAFDPIARAGSAMYIARGKTEEDRKTVDKNGNYRVETSEGSYTLKRLFIEEEEFKNYYLGFSNQTLWPLCHVAFTGPRFNDAWFEGYKKVNEKFAKAIRREITGKSFVWINDYQLSLVPKYLGRPKGVTVGMFWHIPWPTWETFRILPHKKEILESMLTCDFIAFHRNYQARNFLSTVRRELEARIDEERKQVYYKGHVTTVDNLPMGIDTDVVKTISREIDDTLIGEAVRNVLGLSKKEEELDTLFKKYKVILGVDRLDYTKGLVLRLNALEKFFEQNKKYIGRAVYLGVLAPSREEISSYKEIKAEVIEAAERINQRFGKGDWKPIHLYYEVLAREKVINLYRRANVCLVTPRDDGMNLVSKEYIASVSVADNPGMLVLSEFAGSATDLTQALIVNPYDSNAVALAIRNAMEMRKDEKIARIKNMERNLEENNVYQWAMNFIKNALSSK